MDKQKAITLLCQMYLPHFNNEEKEALSMGIEALEQSKNNGWISVKDRLPKKDGKYLTYTISPTDTIYSDLFFKNGIWYIDNGCYDSTIGEVTHWMPLPKPYKSKD